MSLALATDLSALVRDVALTPELWRPRVRFVPEGRYWTSLGEIAGADVWLLTWLPGQSTDLHDHGDSAASFIVVSGVLEEVRATQDGALSQAWHGPGQSANIQPGAIHDVANTGLDPAISIHAYSPKLEVMNFWRPTKHGLVQIDSVRSREPEISA